MTQLQNSPVATMPRPEDSPLALESGLPEGENIQEVPREYRQNANQITKWTLSHLESSTRQREYLERLWIRVESYMEGFHYFTIDATGRWRPLPPKDGEVRSTVPLMRSIYRRELGRFTDNVLTVQGVPTTPDNPYAFFAAHRGGLMVNAWQEEIDFSDIFEDFVSQQLYYGLSGLYRYKDEFRKQVFCEAWPAWELHPIPWYAKKDSQLEGFTRVKNMTREWVRQNVSEEAADSSGSGNSNVGMRVGGSSMGNSVGQSFGMTEDAVKVIWVWLLPTQEIPTGQKYLIVNDKMHRYSADKDTLRRGKLPIEFARYSHQPNNWYGMGLLPTLAGAQAEADRQWTKIVRGARLRNGILFFNDEVVSANDIHDDDLQAIPFDESAYGMNEEFFKLVPPPPANPNIGASLELSQELGRQAAGHESNIIAGKSEGRVEGGSFGRILNANAQAPIAPAFRRIGRVLFNTYQDVLDMISEVWPDGKRVSTVGLYEMANEFALTKNGRPTSENVRIYPSPLMPSGRSEMVNFLFSMRQILNEKGVPEISSQEFRRGLAASGMQPPGIELHSKKAERIKQRVAELYNDGQTPGKFFTDEADMKLLILEDPNALRDELVDRILDPGFRATSSPQVKLAFLKVLQMVRTMVIGDQPNDGRTDENLDLEAFDAAKTEEFLDAEEQNPENTTGQLTLDGIPVGVQDGG